MFKAIFSRFRNPIKKIRSSNTKILLVDDHRMFRVTLRRIIEEYEALTVICEASDGMEAIKLAREYCPDVIIMDINMPGMNGIEATRIITADFPNIRVIGLSLGDEDMVIKEMKNAGAITYLQKADVFESLIETIRAEK